MSQGSYFGQAVSTENQMYTALVKITYFSTTKVREFQMNKFVQYLLCHFLLNAECISYKKTIRPAILNLYNQYNNKSIFFVDLPKESIFLTTIYGLYLSHLYTHYKLHFLHNVDLLCAAFHVLHQHLYTSPVSS